MDKSILSLIILGIALAVLHVPHTVLTLGIIGFLLIAAIKLSWLVMESLSGSEERSQKSTLTLSHSSVQDKRR